MKPFATMTLIVALLCCSKHSDADIENLPLHAKKLTIKLIDSLGWVSLYIPNRYDTSFEWTDESDCGKQCGNEKYRFQPKNLEIIKEIGYYWAGKPPASFDQLTISHSSYFPFHEGSETGLTLIHQHLKQTLPTELFAELRLVDTPPVVFDTLEKINGRLFSVIIAEKYDSSSTKYLKEVLATTTIKSDPITFQYELLSGKNDSLAVDFIHEGLELIKTIQVGNGL